MESYQNGSPNTLLLQFYLYKLESNLLNQKFLFMVIDCCLSIKEYFELITYILSQNCVTVNKVVNTMENSFNSQYVQKEDV